jgi:hypothetical protein
MGGEVEDVGSVAEGFAFGGLGIRGGEKGHKGILSVKGAECKGKVAKGD